MPKKIALCTGITGQTCSYLAELLLSKGYEVHGIIRRASTFNTSRIDHIFDKLKLHYGDMTDSANLGRIVSTVQPDEIYNMAAQSVHEDSIVTMLKPPSKLGSIQHLQIKELFDQLLHSGYKIDYEGTTEVINLRPTSTNKILSCWNNMGTFFKLKQISRHKYKGKIAKLYQKWGAIAVTPNHSIYNCDGELCTPKDNPSLLSIRKLNYESHRITKTLELRPGMSGKTYKKGKHFIWYKDRQPHKKIRRFLSGKDLTNFMKFSGAFISEGNATYNSANGRYDVAISNTDLKWLTELREATKKIFKVPTYIRTHKKKKHKPVYALVYDSKMLYDICRYMFGVYCQNKKLDYRFFNLPQNYLQTLLSYLVKGDGTVKKYKRYESIEYSTTSEMLSCQLSFLFSLLGLDYTIQYSYLDHDTYKIRYSLGEVKSYNTNGGSNKLIWEDYKGYVYDLSVDETSKFIIGPGNVVVHNSHVKVSFDQPIIQLT